MTIAALVLSIGDLPEVQAQLDAKDARIRELEDWLVRGPWFYKDELHEIYRALHNQRVKLAQQGEAMLPHSDRFTLVESIMGKINEAQLLSDLANEVPPTPEVNHG